MLEENKKLVGRNYVRVQPVCSLGKVHLKCSGTQ